MTELTRYQMYINGEWVDAENGATFTSVNPATGQTWAEVPEASEADINRAVEAAHHAFSEGAWATMTPTARGKMLRRLAEVLAEHSEPLGRCETVDTGKLFKETRWQ
ncbi:MAG: aldehyde dehydrogenase family protein, partial [Pseudomonadota bacterium]|nr:aldehyde dehydrogenase family protein [Pseudomonadota bacterium]